MFATCDSFDRSRSNLFDFVVCLLSVGSLLVFHRDVELSLDDVGETFIGLLLLLRYAIQCFRCGRARTRAVWWSIALNEHIAIRMKTTKRLCAFATK